MEVRKDKPKKNKVLGQPENAEQLVGSKDKSSVIADELSKDDSSIVEPKSPSEIKTPAQVQPTSDKEQVVTTLTSADEEVYAQSREAFNAQLEEELAAKAAAEQKQKDEEEKKAADLKQKEAEKQKAVELEQKKAEEKKTDAATSETATSSLSTSQVQTVHYPTIGSPTSTVPPIQKVSYPELHSPLSVQSNTSPQQLSPASEPVAAALTTPPISPTPLVSPAPTTTVSTSTQQKKIDSEIDTKSMIQEQVNKVNAALQSLKNEVKQPIDLPVERTRIRNIIRKEMQQAINSLTTLVEQKIPEAFEALDQLAYQFDKTSLENAKTDAMTIWKFLADQGHTQSQKKLAIEEKLLRAKQLFYNMANIPTFEYRMTKQSLLESVYRQENNSTPADKMTAIQLLESIESESPEAKKELEKLRGFRNEDSPNQIQIAAQFYRSPAIGKTHGETLAIFDAIQQTWNDIIKHGDYDKTQDKYKFKKGIINQEFYHLSKTKELNDYYPRLIYAALQKMIVGGTRTDNTWRVEVSIPTSLFSNRSKGDLFLDFINNDLSRLINQLKTSTDAKDALYKKDPLLALYRAVELFDEKKQTNFLLPFFEKCLRAVVKQDLGFENLTKFLNSKLGGVAPTESSTSTKTSLQEQQQEKTRSAPPATTSQPPPLSPAVSHAKSTTSINAPSQDVLEQYNTFMKAHLDAKTNDDTTNLFRRAMAVRHLLKSASQGVQEAFKPLKEIENTLKKSLFSERDRQLLKTIQEALELYSTPSQAVLSSSPTSTTAQTISPPPPVQSVTSTSHQKATVETQTQKAAQAVAPATKTATKETPVSAIPATKTSSTTVSSLTGQTVLPSTSKTDSPQQDIKSIIQEQKTQFAEAQRKLLNVNVNSRSSTPILKERKEAIDALKKLVKEGHKEALNPLYEMANTIYGKPFAPSATDQKDIAKGIWRFLSEHKHIPSTDKLNNYNLYKQVEAKIYSSNMSEKKAGHKEILKLAFLLNDMDSLNLLYRVGDKPTQLMAIALARIINQDPLLNSEGKPYDFNIFKSQSIFENNDAMFMQNFLRLYSEGNIFEQVRGQKKLDDPILILLESANATTSISSSIVQKYLKNMLKDMGILNYDTFIKTQHLKAKISANATFTAWLQKNKITLQEFGEMVMKPEGFTLAAQIPDFPAALAADVIKISGHVNMLVNNEHALVFAAAHNNNIDLVKWLLDPSNLKNLGKTIKSKNILTDDPLDQAILGTIEWGKDNIEVYKFLLGKNKNIQFERIRNKLVDLISKGAPDSKILEEHRPYYMHHRSRYQQMLEILDRLDPAKKQEKSASLVTQQQSSKIDSTPQQLAKTLQPEKKSDFNEIDTLQKKYDQYMQTSTFTTEKHSRVFLTACRYALLTGKDPKNFKPFGGEQKEDKAIFYAELKNNRVDLLKIAKGNLELALLFQLHNKKSAIKADEDKKAQRALEKIIQEAIDKENKNLSRKEQINLKNLKEKFLDPLATTQRALMEKFLNKSLPINDRALYLTQFLSHPLVLYSKWNAYIEDQLNSLKEQNINSPILFPDKFFDFYTHYISKAEDWNKVAEGNQDLAIVLALETYPNKDEIDHFVYQSLEKDRGQIAGLKKLAFETLLDISPQSIKLKTLFSAVQNQQLSQSIRDKSFDALVASLARLNSEEFSKAAEKFHDYKPEFTKKLWTKILESSPTIIPIEKLYDLATTFDTNTKNKAINIMLEHALNKNDYAIAFVKEILKRNFDSKDFNSALTLCNKIIQKCHTNFSEPLFLIAKNGLQQIAKEPGYKDQVNMLYESFDPSIRQVETKKVFPATAAPQSFVEPSAPPLDQPVSSLTSPQATNPAPSNSPPAYNPAAFFEPVSPKVSTLSENSIILFNPTSDFKSLKTALENIEKIYQSNNINDCERAKIILNAFKQKYENNEQLPNQSVLIALVTDILEMPKQKKTF